MNLLVLDTETTIHNQGSPFDERNKLCCIASFDGIKSIVTPIEYDSAPYGDLLDNIKRQIKGSDFLIGFNLKFDLHWLRRYGIEYPQYCYDCQLAEFIIHGQSIPFPSLGDTGRTYLLGGKLDGGLDRYWEVDIDTTEIPWSELEAYAARDAELTYQIFLEQQKLLVSSPQLRTLVNLANQDLLVLADMEWNGLKFDLDLAKQRKEETENKLDKIRGELQSMVDLPFMLNFNSGDILSCILYGGIITNEWKEQVGVYLSGIKEGQPRYKWSKKEYQLPRLVEPLKGTELKKLGYYETNKDTLRNLPATGKARRIINLILQYSELEKLNSTYYSGIPNLCDLYNWKDGIVHGQYNQVVARTGRLSSSKPNMQNIAGEVDDLIVSRY